MLIAADHIWRGGQLRGAMAVTVEAGVIAQTTPLDAADQPDLHVHVLMPACTDLQVNGGGGVMLNAAPTADTLRRMAAAHRALGTGWLMPTVITDAPEVMERAAEAALAVRGEPGMLGLHLEGPHINPAKRGTHAERFVRPFNARTLALVRRLRQAGMCVIVTLAPEMVMASEIRALVECGAVVSAGHTAASAEQGRAGLEAGVSMFTHLFNAMPPLLHREPGIVAAALLSEGYCGVIADGIHVSWEALRVAFNARPLPDRMFLVSDAMATVGGPNHFSLYGHTIHVENGALVNAEGNLAGAHISMVESLANVVAHGGVPLHRAIAMATDIPRAALGLPPQPGVTPGVPLGDLIALTNTLHLTELPSP